MPTGSRPSLASIAAEVGVSTATVSNAYNRPERVSAAVRDRILAIAAREGYSGPHAAARQLRRGRADALGLLLYRDPGYAFRDPATSGFLEGLADVCAQAGQNLLLICSPSDAGARSGPVVDAVVDGFVVLSVSADDERLRYVAARRLPTVIVDAPLDVPAADWVGPDDVAACRALTEHLLALGHRRIGVVSFPLGGAAYSGAAEGQRYEQAHGSVAAQRIRGIEQALRGAGIADLAIEERAENSSAAGLDATHALLERRPDLTAVCCLSDVLAFGALTAAQQRGLQVASELTVTGFDDVPEAARRGLTTIAQPHQDKGRIAGQLVLGRAGRTAPRRHVLPTVLQVRNTSAPPNPDR